MPSTRDYEIANTYSTALKACSTRHAHGTAEQIANTRTCRAYGVTTHELRRILTEVAHEEANELFRVPGRPGPKPGRKTRRAEQGSNTQR